VDAVGVLSALTSTPITVPAAPTGLTASPGDAQVALSWNASSGATSYNAKRATVHGGPYTAVTNVNTTSCIDTGLMNGATYYYVVSALNSGGESTNSAEAVATLPTTFQWWQSNYFGCTSCPQAQPYADPLGKGMSNTNEFLAGFNPTNPAAHLHIISVARANGTNVVVTYLGASGDTNYVPGIQSRTNVLDFTTGAASGSYANGGWQDTGQTNILGVGISAACGEGTGLGTVTNMTDFSAATNSPSRYYRVRVLVP
jgi:hypothetical protein